MIRSLRKFARAPGADKRMVVLAVCYLAFWRAVVLTSPFRLWSKSLGIRGAPVAPQAEAQTVGQVARLVHAVAGRMPWDANCLNRALAAMSLLKHRRISSTLYFGVRKGQETRGMDAHAWLLVGDVVVTGAEEKQTFVPLLHYTWTPESKPERR